MGEVDFKKADPVSALDPVANRKTPRRTYERLVGVLHKGKYFLQNSLQISEGGMMIELPNYVKRGDFIVVSFILPTSLETVNGRAEVLYLQKVSDKLSKVGIKFINLDTIKRRAIRDFVSSKQFKDVPQPKPKAS